MKRIILLFFLLLMGSSVYSQNSELSPSMLDFWVGNWNLTWKMPDDKIGKGTNNIVKILDGKVIQENFIATDAGQTTGFKGTSISVYNPNTKSWHQAWADNQGGYYDFKGSAQAEKVMFSTQAKNQFLQRMVFYNISEEKFDWDWESSKDGGKTWTLNWQIHYARVK